MGKNKNSDKTKKYKMKTAKVSKKRNDNRKNKGEKKKHPKLKKFIMIFLIICFLLCLIGIGVFAGIFFSDKWKITKEDLEISLQNTIVYDIDGKQIAELTGDENRKIITMSEMGPYLPNAFVAIEDERYYSHYGIDIKRTAGAIVTYVFNGGKSSFGGSTITQQLVKNMMDDDASEGTAGIERKIREWSRAYQIEQMLSKSQILELYLNKIFMGGTVYGVESASQYYFSKSAKDLDLAEAAFIAGINHAPNGYNPFNGDDNSEDIKNRTKTVLSQMKKMRNTNVEELKGLTEITEEEYDKAIQEVENGLKFKKGTITDNSNISFHTAAAIDQVASQLAEEKEINYDTARDIIKNSGYKIYTTQDTSIQDIMEEEYLKDKYIRNATTKAGKKNKQHSQSAMVIIDHKTGYVVGTVGGLGKDSSPLGQNRATQSYLQPGSSIKPLAAVGPALEEKVITAATMYDDSPTSFGGQSFVNSTGYPGIIPVRAAVERSSNIVNMKILANLGFDESIKYLNEFGLSEYTKEDGSLTLTLGGTLHGASPLQMAAAYATIANGGEYIEPTFYTKLESSSGKVVLEPKQEKRRVLSEQNAYVLTNILKSPVYGFWGHATATSCAISGMETAAKTGTTTEYKDRWLCGMTPYYAAATWFGYDEPESVPFDIAGNSNPSIVIWSSVMKKVHKGLKSANFEKPSGITSAKICKLTGKVATDKCTSTYTEIFASGTVPSTCEGHEPVKICKESKKLATEFCPETEEKVYDIKPEKERNASWKTSAGKKYNEVTETCTLHTEQTMNLVVPNVVGKTETQAKDELIGYTIQIEFENDTSKANGIVLKQSLTAGSSVKKGSTIILTINDLSTSEGENTINPPTDPSQNTITNTTTGNTTDKNEIANVNSV